MAHLHSDLPPNIQGHHSEHRCAKTLNSVDDPRLHLWFSLNYLPGTSDVDLLLWHEDVGVFVIEIKGVLLKEILEYGLGRCVFDGRGPSETPLQQALRAMHSLRNYLQGKTRGRLPFLTVSACWPRIRRFEWKQRWPRAELRDLADSMIFEEDLNAGPSVLRRRLGGIRPSLAMLASAS